MLPKLFYSKTEVFHIDSSLVTIAIKSPNELFCFFFIIFRWLIFFHIFRQQGRCNLIFDRRLPISWNGRDNLSLVNQWARKVKKLRILVADLKILWILGCKRFNSFRICFVWIGLSDYVKSNGFHDIVIILNSFEVKY